MEDLRPSLTMPNLLKNCGSEIVSDGQCFPIFQAFHFEWEPWLPLPPVLAWLSAALVVMWKVLLMNDWSKSVVLTCISHHSYLTQLCLYSIGSIIITKASIGCFLQCCSDFFLDCSGTSFLQHTTRGCSKRAWFICNIIAAYGDFIWFFNKINYSV